MQVGLLSNSCTLFAAWRYPIPLINQLDNRLPKYFTEIANFLRVAMCNCLRVAMSGYLSGYRQLDASGYVYVICRVAM